MAQIITGFNGWVPILGDDADTAAQGGSAMQFQSLTNGSTPQQVADAYREWIGQNGGDTLANRNTAAQYLTNLGFSPENIGSTYNLYKDTFNTPAATTATGGAATSAAPSAGSHTVTPYARTPIEPPPMPEFSMPDKPVMQSYTASPYLGQMADSITSQVNENLQRNVLPGINSGAMAAGQYGGSRQGVVQANALNDSNRQLSNALTGMYYGDFNNSMNRNLQQYQSDLNYNLGFGGLQNQYNIAKMNNALGYAQLNNQFDIASLNRGENARQFDAGFGLQQDQFGLNSAMALQNAFNNNANLGLNFASNIYNQPLGYYNQFANAANSFAGQGGVSNQSMPSNPLTGAYGGAVLGNQIYRAWGGGSPNATGGANTLGFGTGSGYGNQDFATAGWFVG